LEVASWSEMLGNSVAGFLFGLVFSRQSKETARGCQYFEPESLTSWILAKEVDFLSNFRQGLIQSLVSSVYWILDKKHLSMASE